MKKLVSLAVIVFLLITISVSVSAATPATISVDSKSVCLDEAFNVVIKLNNNPGIVSANLKITFSEDLELISATCGDVFSTLTYIPPKALSSGNTIKSFCQFAWTGFDIADSDIKDGVILNLRFKFSKSVDAGTSYSIKISSESGDVIDKNLNSLILEDTATITANNHTYTNACDTTCNICNDVRTITHDYVAATCEAPKTCKVCGETIGGTTSHKYDSGKVTKAATCKTTGVKTYTCSVCKGTKTETIAKLTTHTYSNNCDKSCNVCGATRTVGPHKYDNNCDKSCNICGATRTVGAHKYSNTCDTTCNYCGAKRSIIHTYTNSCDTKCNVCGATRTIKHTYSNNCDKTCNVCKSTRTVGAHKYTNSCDTSCNVCKAKRTIKHTYSNNCDTSCNVCKATRTITHSYKTTTTKATLTKNGSIVKKCTVCGKVASKSTIKYVKSFKLSTTTYTYDGKVKTPSITVKDSAGKTLKKNTDYTVTYASGRKNVGTYKVTIRMIGKYSGTKTLTFKITPAKTTVSKLTAGKKSITVAITKRSTQVTGYQIQYSTSKTFSKATTKTISSYKTTKYTLKSLSAKKTYYVRVRTYKTIGKTKYYSGWSTVKSIKSK